MRGKDKKPRKNDKYSLAVSKRINANIDAHRKAVSEGRKNEKDIPSDTPDITKEQALEAINALLPWTQGTNRKLFANKPLYKFILNYTENHTKHGDKVAELVHIVTTDEHSPCPVCSTVRKFVTLGDGYSTCPNKQCSEYAARGLRAWAKLPQEEYDKKVKHSYSPMGVTINSKEWFMQKFGDEWEAEWNVYHHKMANVALQNISKNNKASKAANDSFEQLLVTFPTARCATNNGELSFDVENVPYINKKRIFVDFAYENKIIEYDGEYWHSDNDDEARDKFLKRIGYQVLRISHNECRTRAGLEQNLEKALRFLLC